MAAEEAAAVGLRQGGRSLIGVLAHSRYQALHAAAQGTDRPSDAPEADAAPADVSDLAWALAATRPALEVAVVDLDTRHGLRRVGLGRSLGLAPAAAADRATAIAAAWEAELDPALMAWMGPGDCEELGTILEDLGPESSVADLLAVAGVVAEHSERCEVCGDRRRAMVSVRSLLAQTPLPAAPAALRAVERRRIHRPIPPPPSIDRGPRRWQGWVAAAVIVAVAAGGATAAAATLARRGGNNPREARIEALTKIPAAGSSLVLSPATVPPGVGHLAIANRSSKTVEWTAQSDVPWLTITPASGRLAPKASTVVSVTEMANAPEGDVRAEIRVSAGDGSTAAAEMAGDLERPPDLSATSDGCMAVASAEDEADVANVILHWRTREDGAQDSKAMAESDRGYLAALPSTPAAVAWWVTATDSRGNQAKTPEAALAPGAC